MGLFNREGRAEAAREAELQSVLESYKKELADNKNIQGFMLTDRHHADGKKLAESNERLNMIREKIVNLGGEIPEREDEDEREPEMVG